MVDISLKKVGVVNAVTMRLRVISLASEPKARSLLTGNTLHTRITTSGYGASTADGAGTTLFEDRIYSRYMLDCILAFMLIQTIQEGK